MTRRAPRINPDARKERWLQHRIAMKSKGPVKLPEFAPASWAEDKDRAYLTYGHIARCADPACQVCSGTGRMVVTRAKSGRGAEICGCAINRALGISPAIQLCPKTKRVYVDLRHPEVEAAGGAALKALVAELQAEVEKGIAGLPTPD